RVEPGGCHRALIVEAQPLLDAAHAGALGKIHEEGEIQDERRCKDRVAAEKVDLNLHGIAEPSKDIDVVPALFFVAARRIIIDAHAVMHLAVELRMKVRVEDGLEDAELCDLLRAETGGIVEDLAIPVSKDIGRIPSADANRS